ncbi:hypothetical protein PVAP13_2KG417400 [Panicum virgatum]|uniref:Uncharacterized protein n=1 Tax=Panicum virgatum TaxID=38727 RepID=A0A8T0WPZ3_PANVG|nr:hypothetical protein PVAP13_2KG417400 [Panicum virgatum]
MLALVPSPERRSYSPAKPPPPPPPPFITLYLGAPLPGVDVDDLVALSTNCPAAFSGHGEEKEARRKISGVACGRRGSGHLGRGSLTATGQDPAGLCGIISGVRSR